MKKIITSNADGAVSVTTPTLGPEVFAGDYLSYCAACRSKGLPIQFGLKEFEAGDKYGEYVLAVAEKDAPKGRPYRIAEDANLPQSRVFRNAWTDDNPTETVDVNLPRAREIAHDMRREVRAKKFAPLDIQATIPAEANAAEIARQKVRDDDAAVQSGIDGATDVETLETIVVGYVGA